MQQRFQPNETEKAFAKINLFLDVLRRREDGYHDIGTLFQTIDLHDTLEGALRSDGVLTLSCDRPATERPKQDLTWRAARALQLASKTSLGADLSLTKRLPASAGMGGGSADAAAALRLLNRLWELQWSQEQLATIGSQLGADIPFLIGGGTAFAEGIGEQLNKSSPPPPSCALLIATPHASVSTAQAYASLRPSGEERWTRFRTRWLEGVDDVATLGSLLFNKFEESVPQQHPAIAALSAELRKTGAHGVLLSGSGASVFALYESIEEADFLLKRLQTACRFSATASFL